MKTAILKINPANPRKIAPAQLLKLQRSIQSFEEMMTLRPIVYDPETGIVLGGNQRLAAILALGMEEIPDNWVKPISPEMTDEQKKEFILKDNASYGEWDWDILSEDFAEFDFDELAIDIPIFPSSKPKAQEDDYVLPDPATIKTNIKPGDLITIGRHRIICGDSTNVLIHARLMQEQKANMIFTDPPYNVNYSGSGKNTKTTIANDNMNKVAFKEFLDTAFVQMNLSADPKAPVYVCHNYKEQATFETALRESGYIPKTQIVWVKPSAGLGMNEYRPMHELIFYAVPQDAKPAFYGDRTNTTVWKDEWTDEQIVKAYRRNYQHHVNGNSTVWMFGRDSDYVHPTQKPVLLVAKAIENSSRINDIILDPFLGSGTTVVAAHQLGRICYGIELEPKFCQAIINRMELLEPGIKIEISST